MNKFLQKISNGDFDLFINGTAIIGLLVVGMKITNKIWERAEQKLKLREDYGYHQGWKECSDGYREMQRMEACITKDKA